MGCRRTRIFISFVFLLILSTTHFIKARPIPKSDNFSQTVNEDEMKLRSQIGSRPPRCEGRCHSCGHCEAIQVPTNPQVHGGNINSTHFSDVSDARRDDYSNYKPLSWKCKCGNLIFNP